MKATTATFFLSLAALLTRVQTATATNYELTPDQPRTIASVAGATDSFNTILFTNRSYCCTITAESTFQAHFGTPIVSGGYTIVDRGKSDPVASRDAAATADTSRKCFYAPLNTPNAVATVTLPILIGQGVGMNTATNVTGICEATALIGGYNTSVTDFNFLEISISDNNLTPNVASPTTINGLVLVRDVVHGTNFEAPFSATTDLQTGLARVDVNVHGLVNNRSFGPVIINHDGTPGSIAARLVQYNITSQSPLAFVPVLEQQFVAKGARH